MISNLLDKFIKRLSVSIRFRLQPAKKWYMQKIVGPLRRTNGPLSRQLEYPFGLFSPQHKKEIFVTRHEGLGDVLMSTSALREFKKQNPFVRINFFTNYEKLVRGLPYIDAVYPYDQRPWDSLVLRYEESLPPVRHIAKIFGDQLNVEVTDVTPDCVFPSNEMETIKLKYGLYRRPWLVVNRKAGYWTPNKDWSDESWDTLIPNLLRLGTVFEIGMGKFGGDFKEPHYLNLIGKTTQAEMIALIASADLQIGPISGPVHIAAAARVRSVVIYGGYESISCSSYEQNINLGHSLDCSPCWLTTPCPINKKCLAEISPERVLIAVEKALQSNLEARNNIFNTEDPKLNQIETKFPLYLEPIKPHP